MSANKTVMQIPDNLDLVRVHIMILVGRDDDLATYEGCLVLGLGLAPKPATTATWHCPNTTVVKARATLAIFGQIDETMAARLTQLYLYMAIRWR